MALVNQQQQTPEGQGNPNYILYKLASQQTASACNSSTGPGSSCVFNDVTSGTIAMPCQNGSPNCTVNTAGHSFGVLSGYSASSGYDLATGLGTINVGNLLSKWSSVAFRPTTTTLNLSPTSSLTHGQSVTVTGSVAPSSGTGAPTGSVSLLTSNGQSAGNLTLSNGNLSGSTTLLPGGTYTVSAHYAGDTTFGGSDSAPVNITIGKENSTSHVSLETFDWQGNLISVNASSAVYGSPYLLRMDVLNSGGSACAGSNGLPQFSCPTGNLTLTDNGNPLDLGTYSLNSLGYAEDQFSQLSGGNHSVKVQYAGDSSYNASSASTTYTISKAATSTSAPANFNIVQVGAQAFFVTNIQATPTSGVAPMGSVTFLVNGTPRPEQATFIPTSGGSPSNNFTASSSAQLFTSASPFPTPGTYTVVASYSGDGNYQASTSAATNYIVKFGTPSLSLQASSSTVTAGSTITITAIVAGQSKTIAPTGNVSFSAYEGPVQGSVSYSTVTNANTGNLDLQATVQVTANFSDFYQAQYSGDTNYPSTQTNGFVLQIAVTGSDFGLLTLQPGSFTVFAGGSGSLELLVGVQSTTVPVTFAANACSGLPSEATCSVAPSAASTTGAVVVQVVTTAPHSRMARYRSAAAFWPNTLMPFAAVLLIGVPRRRLKVFFGAIAVVTLLLFVSACGGGNGGGGGGGGGGGNTDPGTPKGTYNITVTATSGSYTHTTNFTMVVQ